jgi:hypothetical protein
LTGSVSGSAASGTWSGGAGIFTPNNTTLNAVYTPTAGEITAGTVTLTLTTNDPTGPCSAAADQMVITINPSAIVSAGVPLVICSNTSATMAGSFGGGASSAIWSTSGSGTFNNNTPSAVYTPSVTDINAGSVTLTYTTNNPLGPCGSVSANIILTIKKAVIITNQPSNTSKCASFPADLSVVAIGDGLIYQWYKGIVPVGTPVVNSANISGAQLSNLHFDQVNLTDDGPYYVVVSGTSPCSSVTSAQRTLNVDQAIIVSTQPISQTLCVGSNATFTVVANANGDPLTYQWRKNGTNLSEQTSASLTINNILAGDAANYDVVISGPVGYTCSTVQSAIAALTVTQIPTATISYGGTPFCKDISTAQSVTRTGTNAFTGGTYSYSVVSGGSTLSLDTSTGAITPSTSSAGTYTVTYTIPASGGCSSEIATTNVTITEIPTATISYVGTSFCNSISGVQVVTLNGTNAYLGGNYSAPIGLSINSSTGSIIPSSSTAGTYIVTYTIPASGGCNKYYDYCTSNNNY